MQPISTPEIKIHLDENDETVYEPIVRVIIHSDDGTLMDFLTHLLINIFKVLQVDAVQVMLTAYYRGEAIEQILPKSKAEKRVNKSHFVSGLEGYPLHFSLEPE